MGGIFPRSRVDRSTSGPPRFLVTPTISIIAAISLLRVGAAGSLEVGRDAAGHAARGGAVAAARRGARGGGRRRAVGGRCGVARPVVALVVRAVVVRGRVAPPCGGVPAVVIARGVRVAGPGVGGGRRGRHGRLVLRLGARRSAVPRGAATACSVVRGHTYKCLFA